MIAGKVFQGELSAGMPRLLGLKGKVLIREIRGNSSLKAWIWRCRKENWVYFVGHLVRERLCWWIDILLLPSYRLKLIIISPNSAPSFLGWSEGRKRFRSCTQKFSRCYSHPSWQRDRNSHPLDCWALAQWLHSVRSSTEFHPTRYTPR